MADETEAQKRLIEIETRLAFQEQTLQEMSDVVARQQAEIERLTLAVKELRERLRVIASPVADPSEETPPPHY